MLIGDWFGGAEGGDGEGAIENSPTYTENLTYFLLLW